MDRDQSYYLYYIIGYTPALKILFSPAYIESLVTKVEILSLRTTAAILHRQTL